MKDQRDTVILTLKFQFLPFITVLTSAFSPSMLCRAVKSSTGVIGDDPVSRVTPHSLLKT